MRPTTVALWTAMIALAGCFGDADDDDPSNDNVWHPSLLPETITGFDHLGNPETAGATGIWLHDDHAYLSGGEGLRIYDIRDPEHPVLVASDIEGTTGSRDVDILVHPDGRTFAILAHGGPTISITDVTDPADPRPMGTVTDIGPAHNIAVVPGSTLVYNSRSISQHVPEPGTTGQIDIIDLADPTMPVVSVFRFPAVVMDPTGLPRLVTATTCHDITFTPELERAYCAGVTQTHVWDISDPAMPVILQVIDTPLNQIHHGAWGARGGDLLIIGDEVAGAAAPVPNCLDPAPNPYAQLWFWDISDLSAPTPLGYYQISHNAPAEDVSLCTTHFGTLVEDRDLFVIGWYSAGTSLIDFSDPSSPTEVWHFVPEGTNTWDARYYKGHVYTGDTGRGMDILRLV